MTVGNIGTGEAARPFLALPDPRWFRVGAVLWLVGAQVWYYFRFKPLLWPAIQPLLRRLWRF